VTAPCETCKGTTVIDMGTGYQTIWQSCPDCQPKPEPVSDPNERGGKTCHAKTLYVTHIFDGENVVRGGNDGQLYVATFADEREANSYVSDKVRGPFLVNGIREGEHEWHNPDDVVRIRQLEADLYSARRNERRYLWLRKGEPNVLHASTASMSDGCGPHVVQTLPGIAPQDMRIWGEWLDNTIDAAMGDGK
jgi:hypothetical protein